MEEEPVLIREETLDGFIRSQPSAGLPYFIAQPPLRQDFTNISITNIDKLTGDNFSVKKL